MSAVRGGCWAFRAVLCFGLAISPANLRAESPRDELLRLVPQDVGFCAVLQNLREHYQAVSQSEFARSFRANPLGAHILTAAVNKLGKADQVLQANFKMNLAQLRDEILGDAIVFCYRPGPPGKPEEEQGLLLLRARDERLLGHFLNQFNIKQRESGELQKLETLTYRDLVYYRRTERGKSGNFYFVNGPILGFSSQERMLQQALERSVDPRESSVRDGFHRLGLDASLASLWINPRAFDTALAQKLAETKGAHAFALRTVQSYWQAVNSIALSLAVNEDIQLSLTVRARSSNLMPAARRLAQTAHEPSLLWQSFPDKALLAAATRIDVPALLDFVQGFVDKESCPGGKADVEKALGAVVGKDVVERLFAQLGPDVGFVVFPPAGKSYWVPQGLVALRVRGDANGDRADLTIYTILNALSTLAVYNLNGGRPGGYRLATTESSGTEIRYLENDEVFPGGLQPAFALKNGFLTLATSAKAIERFNPKIIRPQAKPLSPELPLLRISFRGLEDYLKEHKSSLAQFLDRKNPLSADEILQRLSNLEVAFQLLDNVEASSTIAPDQAALKIRLRLARPLK
jgi:hypothetical protein